MNIKINMNKSGLGQLQEASLLYLETLANNVQVEAKSLVNVDTGDLRKSIEVKEGDTKWERTIGSELKYAIYQELGWRTKKSGELNPPSFSPYLRPALDRVIGDMR